MALNSAIKGKRGQKIALVHLNRIGLHMGQMVETPYNIIANRGSWIKIVRSEKVTGDIIGTNEQGMGVLAEVKTGGERLLFSTLTKHGEHQIRNLNRQASRAIALVVWVKAPDEVYPLQWPIAGLVPQKSLSPETASELAVVNLAECSPWADANENYPWHLL